jgi:hypothetical protein
MDVIIFSIFLSNAILFVWCYRFLPLQDYPDWLLQGSLFLKALYGNLPVDYSLVMYPVPNAISTLILGGLNTIFQPEISGKIFLTISLFQFFVGSVYLFATYDNKRMSFIYYIPLLLIFNTFFFHGYINYFLGLGILFWGLGYILRKPLSEVNPLVLLFITVLLFFSHAIVFGIFILYLFILLCFQENRRKAIGNIMRGTSISLVLSILYIINHMKLTEFSPNISGKMHGFEVPGFEDSLQYFSIFHSFYPFSDSQMLFVKLINTFNHIFCYGIFVLLILGIWYLVRTKSRDIALLVMLSISIFFYIFSPSYFLGIVRPGERFLYFGSWMIFACFIPQLNEFDDKINNILKGILLAFLCLQTIFLHFHAGKVAKTMATIYLELEKNVHAEVLDIIAESHFDYQTKFDNDAYHTPFFMSSHSPLMRLPFYLAVGRQMHAHIFPTGLILDKNSELKNDSLSLLQNTKGQSEEMLILGEKKGNEFIAQVLSDKYYNSFVGDYLIIADKRSH